jgi:hypothetical protein
LCSTKFQANLVLMTQPRYQKISDTIATVKLSEPVLDLEYLIKNKLKHLISTDSPFFEEELNWAKARAEDKVISSDVSTLSLQNLTKSAKEVLHETTTSLGLKKEICEKVRNHPQLKRAMSLLGDIAILALDEMYTNAERCLRDSNRGEITTQVLIDQSSLWLFVQDNHGSLQVQDLLNRLKNIYERGVISSMEKKKDGAGIGTYLVFKHAGSWFLGVDPGKFTLAGIRLHLSRDHDLAADQAKSMHLLRRS